MEHGATRHSAHAIRGNLRSTASQAKQATRSANISGGGGKSSSSGNGMGASHRHAAAGIRSDQQCLQGLAFCIFASIGPE
jgi:hypothetical protein